MLRDNYNHAYRMNESDAVNVLLNYLNSNAAIEEAIAILAEKLVKTVREHQSERSAIEVFMLQYDLSMHEGILMMCLAEALLRIPDKNTQRLLLKDKLTDASWDKYIGESESWLVNMATQGLVLSSKILRDQNKSLFTKLISRSGEPVIRRAVRAAMKILSKEFVIGQSIQEAIRNSQKLSEQGYRFSYDMLGEVARTQQDADRYYKAYYDAIDELGKIPQKGNLITAPSISVKLSALHPRYEYSHREAVVPYLIKKVKALCLHAKNNHISLAIDAEETNRLELSLEIIEAVFRDPELRQWDGLGLAVQAYQKRAFYLIDWLIHLARDCKKRIQVRLVKGAYWDAEIKQTQVEGFINYPVFTRKNNTDVSYLACAKKMLSAVDAIYPQFATHNAYSVAAILVMMGDKIKQQNFEFQSLQGMGRALHNEMVSEKNFHLPCRIYAPVGTYQDLLPYLVRRLLENGANSSFVNRIADPKVMVSELIQSPVKMLQSYASIPHPRIPLPRNIYGKKRENSMGIDFSDITVQVDFNTQLEKAATQKWQAAPFLRSLRHERPIYNPADRQQLVGHVEEADAEDVEKAVQIASQAYEKWMHVPLQERAAILRKMGDLLEEHRFELMFLAIKEAGKTLSDANAEVREAVDFCRYYAEQALLTLVDVRMPGPTGESNVLRLYGRGVIFCISPWNFPLAIFTGQVGAALVAGNTVIAKPAEQTPLIAALAVKLFYKAGLPTEVLQFLPGRGKTIGNLLVNHPAIAGIVFTGSTETARFIALSLANRPGPILPFIAETGGINAMIADSSALPEQLVRDVIISAFGSAGQRCSALRLLYVQKDIADTVIKMLAGAMAEITVGDPSLLSTDVGPVIGVEAQKMLLEHSEMMSQQAKTIYQTEVRPELASGTFVGPKAFELPKLDLLQQEVFGPILHIMRYDASDLDKVIDDINHLGYGLTFGIQSRIDETIHHIQSRIKAGNIYVNRSMIGAVVGVQPFGGNRLSGTGPKAGGPHYLTRLCQENTLTIDTTAVGGNASLMVMEGEV